jgi:hypothetical protein
MEFREEMCNCIDVIRRATDVTVVGTHGGNKAISRKFIALYLKRFVS